MPPKSTPDHMVASALAVIAADGLDAATVKAVCAHAGVSRATFYRHFDDRQALLAACVEARTRLRVEIFREAFGNTTDPVHVHIPKRLAAFLVDHRNAEQLDRAMVAIGPSIMDTRANAFWDRMLVQATVAYLRRFEGDLIVDDLELAAYVSAFATRYGLMGWIRDRQSLGQVDDSMVAALSTMLLRYLVGIDQTPPMDWKAITLDGWGPDPAALAMVANPKRKQPTQERSRFTVAAIVEATRQLIEKEGLDAVTTVVAAERAGVSIGTLYQYFPSREALLRAVGEDELLNFFGLFQRCLARQDHLGPMAVLGSYITSMLEQYRASPRLLEELVRATPRVMGMNHNATVDRMAVHVLARYFRSLQDDGAMAPLPDPTLAAYLVVIVVRYTTLAWARDRVDRPEDDERFGTQLRQLIARFLALDEATPGMKPTSWSFLVEALEEWGFGRAAFREH